VVLPAKAAETVLVDPRLGHDRHPVLELLLASLRDPGHRLVVAEADAVAGVMRELLEAGRGTGLAACSIYLAAGRTGPGSVERGVLRLEDGAHRLALPVGGSSRHDGAGVIGPVPIGRSAELEHDYVVRFDAPVAGAEVLPADGRLRA